MITRIRAVLVALVVAPGLTRAQSGRWERQVMDALERSAAALHHQGLEPVGVPQVGVLLTEESAWFGVTLRAGLSYTVVGVCDNDCTGLDLALYRGAHHEFAATRGSALPMVEVTPRETLRYQVKVTLTRCGVSPCWFGIGVYRRVAIRRAP